MNSLRQFSESPDFDEAVVDAVADNQGAYKRISDLFFSGASGRSRVMRARLPRRSTSWRRQRPPEPEEHGRTVRQELR